jgi:hypothetical protein
MTSSMLQLPGKTPDMATENKNSTSNKRAGNRRQSDFRPTTEASAADIFERAAKNLEIRIGIEVATRLEAFSNDLRQQLRNQMNTQATRVARTVLDEKIRHEIEESIRLEIRSELRAELEDRMASIGEERTRFDPAALVEIFTEQAGKLLEWEVKDSNALPTKQQLANAVKQGVLESLRSRRLHLTQLVELDRMANEGNLDQVQPLLREWFLRAGLVQATDPVANPEHFTAVNDPSSGIYIHVITPAYIDESTGQVIRTGRLMHSSDPQTTASVKDGE